MKKRLALVLSVVMLLALIAIPASAAGFPDPGVGTTYTELVNKEAAAASASVMYYNTSGGTIAGPNRTIPSNGSIMIDPDSTQLPQNFAGSAVVSSNKRLASVVNTVWTGGPGDAYQMGLYSGVSAGSSKICFPSLWKYDVSGNAIISSFAVQNTGTSSVNVDITYTGRDGVVAMNDSDTIPAGAQHTYDLATSPNLPSNWQGSVQVAVNGSGSIAGVGVATWAGPDPDTARSATYNAADCSGASGPTTLVAPTHYRVRPGGGWILWSAVNVQNLSGNTATLTLTYTARDGDPAPLVLTTTIPPNATVGANTRNGGNFPASAFDPLNSDEWWDGSVKIEVSEPAVATVISQWNRDGKVEAGVYAAADVSAGATKVFAPGLKRITSGSWENWSAVIVQNLGTGAADVTVDFYDRSGTKLLSFPNDSIAPGAALGYNTRNGGSKPAGDFNVLGNAYEGHAVVTSNNGQPLAVVVNGVSGIPDGGSGTTNGIAE
ncbi:MAG TPA: hypothetical protein G4N94_07675 [Caldilineae bacterium]|nr:hypothetical protein [Caldilineae bacterium]